MEHFLNSYAEILISVLQNLQNQGPKNYLSCVFQCNALCKIEDNLIRSSKLLADYERILRPLNGPVLYYFEIISSTDNGLIRNAIKNYSLRRLKKTPALRKGYDKNSKILYVGKVKRKFWNRVIQHIGIYNNSQTQGLQLKHWTHELDLELKLHVYQYDKGMSNLIALFERKLAIELSPIIGQH